MIPLFLACSALLHATGWATVFQGACSDRDVFCEQLCLTLSPETYECGCWNDHTLLDDGLSCRLNATRSTAADRPTHHATDTTTVMSRATEISGETAKILHSDAEPPLRFTGHDFAEFPVDDSFYLESNVTVEFKISARRDGILLFAGEFEGDDFFSLALQGPNIILRYDCGEGAIEDLYRGPFGIGEWHSLSVERKYCERTEMRADGGSAMVDETGQFKYYKGITVDRGIFVGGAPSNIDFLDARAGADRGIEGCVRKVTVNDKILLDSQFGVNRAINRAKIGYCSSDPSTTTTTTTTRSVLRRKTASPIVLREIVLKTGESSSSEEDKGRAPGHIFERNIAAITHKKVVPMVKSVSVEDVVLERVTEAENSTLSTTVEPVTTTAARPMRIVEFSGNSYVSVPAPEDVGEYLEVVMHFKPNLNQGVLFYWRDEERFLVLSLEAGFLVVHVSMGADMATLRSENVLSLHTWHKLEVWRSGKGILLKVDRQSWIETELSSFGRVGVARGGGVSIGGADRPLPAHLQHLHGFHGCIKRVLLNGHLVHLSAHPSLDIRECGSDPCASSGCPSGCASRHDSFVCLCQWPSYGRTCGMKSVNSPEAMNFGGHSYLEFTADEYMQHITGDQLRLMIEFRLNNETNEFGVGEQILAYAGSGEGSGDFLRLTITRDRTVRFSTNLGSGIVDLTHPTAVDYDRWTTIDVFRDRRTIRLSMNGVSPVTTVAPGTSEQLNVYKSFFVGGYESDTLHAEGFLGCIQMIQVGPRIIRQPSDTATAINIRECSV